MLYIWYKPLISQKSKDFAWAALNSTLYNYWPIIPRGWEWNEELRRSRGLSAKAEGLSPVVDTLRDL